jgi:CRISPR-associated protein Csd2
MNRYDFVYLFDVKDANPNGDPDAGNLPRVDPETGHGLVTDVCLKRKIRNYVAVVKENKPPYEIYFADGAILNSTHKRAYEASGLKPESKKLPKKIEDARKVTLFMCENFFDIRTFGAVMSTEVNCGQVRGPVQLSFARSIDPIISSEHAITRSSVTNEKDMEKERTMGRKYTVPYALYRAHGVVNPFLATDEKKGTRFGEKDLELLWEALKNAFEHDQSAARPAGSMAVCKLIVFKHKDHLGNAPSHKLFELVTIERSGETQEEKSKAARAFTDYTVTIDKPGVPAGVELIEMV